MLLIYFALRVWYSFRPYYFLFFFFFFVFIYYYYYLLFLPLVLPLLPRIAWTGLIDLKGAETFTLKYHINSPCPCSILSYLAVYISVFFSFIKKKKKNRYTSVLGNKDRNRQGFRNMLSRALSLLNTTVTTKWKRSNQWPSPS